MGSVRKGCRKHRTLVQVPEKADDWARPVCRIYTRAHHKSEVSPNWKPPTALNRTRQGFTFGMFKPDCFIRTGHHEQKKVDLSSFLPEPETSRHTL